MASADTKDRILEAAEQLFAHKGFAATSLRTIIAEAGVNLAAVHYHFGSKEALIREVFARRFEPLNRERLELLAAYLEATPLRKRAVEGILEMLVSPILRLLREKPGDWSTIGILVGRVHTEPDRSVRRLFHGQFQEVSEAFSGALRAVLPKIPEQEFAYRFHFAIAAMAASLVDPDEVRDLSGGRIDPIADPALFARRWVTFVAAGLRAAPAGKGAL
jgi:AcrR family transcriptional regulator